MMYDMSFAQLLTLIEVRNNREKRAYDAAQQDSDIQRDQRPPQDEPVPYVSQVQRVFGSMAP